MKYKVLYGDLTPFLEEEVARFIEMGWKPFGGVAVCPGTGFYQAVTKDSDDFVVGDKTERVE